MTDDVIIKFPASKRRLTVDEEHTVKTCINLIKNTYSDPNPFITDKQKTESAEAILRECIRRILELNED